MEHAGETETDPIEALKWVNAGRAALSLLPLSELPKGVAPPRVRRYLDPWRDRSPVADIYYDPEREKALEAFSSAALRELEPEDDEVRFRPLGWLDRASTEVWSPIGISLHCEATSSHEHEGEWFLQVGHKAVAKALAKAYDTYGRILSFRREQVKRGTVVLPNVLNQFMSDYSKGLYPQLTGPSRLELRLYELQSEIDMRAFDRTQQWYFVHLSGSRLRFWWLPLWWWLVTVVTVIELARLIY
jgi:hypothetical protein